MRYETGGICITELVGLRAKFFFCKISCDEIEKNDKGIKKRRKEESRKFLQFDEYKIALFDKEFFPRECTILKTKNMIYIQMK